VADRSLIESYLASLARHAREAGADVDRLLAETADHLREAVAVHRAAGAKDPEERALAEFGEPREIAIEAAAAQKRAIPNARSLMFLALAIGSLCVAAGLGYLSVHPTELSIGPLVALGFVGGTTLMAIGVWQHVDASSRSAVAMAIAAALFVIASALGFIGCQIARSARLEQTALPATLHVIGFFAGLVVVALALNEARGRMRGDSAGPAPGPVLG
jgi:hypothetical protein